ncbi:hypothetical protein VF13_37725 [Nostoc linckia z16]|nr:hypothetical protein VF13_37725 [Nostoc linckia z16]
MKQVVWFAIINYLGTGIGIISSLLIYPKNFEFQGTVRYIDSISQLLFPLMVLGASQSLIKFYPALDEQKQKQLFTYSVVSVASISIFVLFGIVLYANQTSNEFSSLIYYAYPISIVLAFVELFKKQLQDLQKIAVPTLFEKIIPKVVLPATFLMVIYGATSQRQALWLYVSGYILILVFTAVYLLRHYSPVFNYRFKTLFGEISRRDYFRYSLYSLAGSLGSLLAFRIDGLIIPNYISMRANGVFSTGAILATTLQIPAVGMFALYAPIISNYLKDHNLRELSVKYREVARLLFFIGALLYGCILLGVEDLFRLMPDYNKLAETIPIILILGLSVVINMATGFNGEIITYSKYYRFNLVAVLLLIVLNVSLNLVFIRAGYGIAGVAWASFISMTIFNIAKLTFIRKKFGLLPFDGKFLKLSFIFLVTGGTCYLLPDAPNHILNLIYKCGLFTAANIVFVQKLRLVYQVNEWLDKAAGVFKK